MIEGQNPHGQPPNGLSMNLKGLHMPSHADGRIRPIEAAKEASMDGVLEVFGPQLPSVLLAVLPSFLAFWIRSIVLSVTPTMSGTIWTIGHRANRHVAFSGLARTFLNRF